MRKPDRSRAWTHRRFHFEPYRVTDDGTPLTDLSLRDDEELIVFSRGGQERALLLRQMSFHHVAQGELAGEPYLVSF